MPYSIDHPVMHWITIIGCSFCALLLTSSFCWSFWHTTREGIRHLRRLHQVPCDRCRYFTGEHLLKCTVHPCKAFSEDAIGCLDFAPTRQTLISTPECDQYKHKRTYLKR